MTYNERAERNRLASNLAHDIQAKLQQLEQLIAGDFGVAIGELGAIKQAINETENVIQWTDNAPMTPKRAVA